jgi:hypothetical protein
LLTYKNRFFYQQDFVHKAFPQAAFKIEQVARFEKPALAAKGVWGGPAEIIFSTSSGFRSETAWNQQSPEQHVLELLKSAVKLTLKALVE